MAYYDEWSNFAETGFDLVAAGWTLVPESGTGLSLGVGLVFSACGASLGLPLPAFRPPTSTACLSDRGE